MNQQVLVAGVWLYHSTHCSCVTLSLTSHCWHASLTSFSLIFNWGSPLTNFFYTRIFIVLKLKYESFLFHNQLQYVEASVLTQIILYLLVILKLVMNIFFSNFQCSELLIFLVWDQTYFLFNSLPKNHYYIIDR